MVVTVVGTTATWEIDGLPIAQLDTTIGATFPLDGNISIGYVDPFTSVSDNPAVSFGLADNVRVLVPHTPGVNGDFDGDADVDLTDYRYFADCLSGPGTSPLPSTGLICSGACEAAFDTEADGDVDLRDFQVVQGNIE
jgi:hypothetical protein